MRRPVLITLLSVVASVAAFVVGGHFAASSLIEAERIQRIEDLNAVALRRSEAAVDFGIRTLDELAERGALACTPSGLQAVRLHVYQRGAVKDIRYVRRNGTVLCSAYSETLEFDRGWTTREFMLPAADASSRLFQVEQFIGTALGVMRDVDDNNGLVAILGVNDSLFDIMPEDLRGHSDVALELWNGEAIAHAGPAEGLPAGNQLVRSVATSNVYPLRTIIRIEHAALAAWNREAYMPILLLSLGLGVVFGLLLGRALSRPTDPLDELDRAIAAGEIKPHFQPIFELKSRKVVGAELLARWTRSDGTSVPPSRFIELAEDGGRIGALTWELLSAGLRELRPLLKADSRFKLSVNISPRHFVSNGFVDDLRRVVAEEDVSPRQVTLELTEREGFEDACVAARVVSAVRALGFRVAMDDVGIGHSGLSHIQKLGVDMLKIDKFFIDSIKREHSARVVVEMLVALAAEMRMTIIAEGIESDDQIAELVSCGVGSGQGYVVSPPLAPAAFLEFVAESKGIDGFRQALRADAA